MLNRVTIIGRLTADPELRTTTTGKSVCGFTVALNDQFNKEKSYFFKVNAWGATAEFVANYLNKGRLVAVDGRLDQRKYEDKDGNQRVSIEIVADSVQGLDRPRDEQGDPTTNTSEAGDFDPFQDE